MIAMALDKTGKVFNSFDNNNYATFIYRLNPVYKLLNAQLFLRQFLNKKYDNIQAQLEMILYKYIYFNFVTNNFENM